MQLFFNSLTSVIAEFTTGNFSFIISSFCSSLYLVKSKKLYWKYSIGEKLYINYWNLMNERKQPFTKVFFKIAAQQSIELIL